MIKLENVGKKYGDQLIFKNVSLEANPGDFVGIIGKTGCGKSTLLNIISGYEPYDIGSNMVNGKELRDYTGSEVNYLRNKRVAFLFQNFNLINELSIYENLKLSLNLSVSKSKLIDEYLDKVGMLEYKHKKIKNLSGGQKQRIALLRAIIKDFDVLICDEPTGNLDDENSELILDLIKELCKDKVVIMVTHKRSVANRYFNKIYEYNYDQSTFELKKDNRNNHESQIKEAIRVRVSTIGTIVHSLKRLLMLKMYNIALVLFIGFFMLSFANSIVLSGSKYEELILGHEMEFNPLRELKGYSEFEADFDKLEESENIDFIAANHEFVGPIKLFEASYKYRKTPLINATNLITIDNGEVRERVINGDLSGGKFVVPVVDQITLTTLDVETFPHKDILVGRMPENDYEVIIDVVTLIKLIEEFGFKYSEYMNGNDSIEKIKFIMDNKHLQFYHVEDYTVNKKTRMAEQIVTSVKLKIVGFLDSKHLSGEIAGIYASENTLNIISELFYKPEIGDVIIYKADPSEETHDKVMEEIKDTFTLDRERIDNIDGSYINVKTMVGFNYFLALLSLLIFLVGFVTLLVYTFSHYKHDIALYRSLGYSNIYVIVLLSLNNIVLTAMSYVFALFINNRFVGSLLSYDSDLLHYSNNQIVIGLLISVALILSVNIAYVMKYRKKSINSIL